MVNLASFYMDEFPRMLNGETGVNLGVADRRSLKKVGLIKPVAKNRIHGLVTWNYVKYSWWITFLHCFGSERSCSGFISS